MTKPKPRTRLQKELRIVRRVSRKLRGTYGTYTREQLELAITAVVQKTLSVYAAAKQFHLPRASLQNHLKCQSANPLLGIAQPTPVTVADAAQQQL